MDPAVAAEVDALISRNDDEFKFHLDRYKYPDRYEGAVSEEHRASAEAFLQTLEGLLDGRDFLFGTTRGFADAAIAPFVRQFANTDRTWFDQAPYPRVQSWLGRELESPFFLGMMKKYAQWEEGTAGVLFPPKSDG